MQSSLVIYTRHNVMKIQRSFADIGFCRSKLTKRQKFLDEMDKVMPWERMIALIEPHYHKTGNGRRPSDLEVMLRIHFLQQWFNLSDPAMEDEIHDSSAIRQFLSLDPFNDTVPDESTILRFRHLLERHDLASKLLESVNADLMDKGLLLRGGTIVDATLIAAPSSTKNKKRKRDPEMSSTKKGNQWHFGMKLHIGVDAQSGLVHTAGATTAKVHDSKVFDELIREDDAAVFGDKGYVNNKLKRSARKNGIYWGVLDKARPKVKLSVSQKRRNHKLASIRAKVEHPFRVIKCQFGYRKTRYRGIVKNGQPLFALLLSANLYAVRHKIMGLQKSCA